MNTSRLAPLAAALTILIVLSGCTTNTSVLSEALSSSGSVSAATDWEKSVTLSSEYGSTVTFSAENTGSTDLILSLNSETCTLTPGEQKSISATFSEHSEDFCFRAVPCTSGEITFRYDIAQCD